jgi:hypothetical protein
MVFWETKGGCGRVARNGLPAREDARSQDPAGIAKKHQPPKSGGSVTGRLPTFVANRCADFRRVLPTD